MIDFSPKNGVLGDPTLATPEKGRRFFEAATKKAAEFLIEFSTWDLDTLSVINPD
jgi:creatinine amidohydrolase/Fe(II)-dependent formamide hydrolase-like protein